MQLDTTAPLNAVSMNNPGKRCCFEQVVDTLVRSGGVDMIVVDSVAALTPRAEIEGEIGSVLGASVCEPYLLRSCCAAKGLFCGATVTACSRQCPLCARQLRTPQNQVDAIWALAYRSR